MNPAPQPGPLGIAAVWDAIAGGYARDVTPFFARYGEEALRLVAVDRSAHVLDGAAGPGTMTFLLAPRVARVSAIDFSPKMIEELRARADRESVGNVDARLMDAQALTFADSTFDAAFCLFAFMFFPDRGRAFGEMLRVLRPGGQALVATWAPIERRPFIRIGIEAMAEAFPEVPRMQKGDLQQPEACIAEMTAAGFGDVTTQSVTSSLRVDSADHYLQIMERSGPAFAALRQKFGD